MTKKQESLRTHLKRLGFTQGNQVELYGELFELLGDPIVLTDNFGSRRRNGEQNRAVETYPHPTNNRERGKSTAYRGMSSRITVGRSSLHSFRYCECNGLLEIVTLLRP